MHLKNGSLLQGGRYRIEKVLGQGGFGITYLGVQVGLNRQVAIKEFFMKEYCNREEDTSHVTVPSVGSKEQVIKFRQKFVKEAQNIATLNHPSIIRIHDVFEEHETAYYVMEYHNHGSLSDLLKHRGRLEEADALRYIRQIADALAYIHERNMNHLDIKPSNVLLDDKGNAVLIDFGMSKRYDEEGNQTSTTPVGISHGYAPIEQYKKGGVGTFSPASDIYSLGATLYKLLTGQTPPDANDIMDEGLPPLPAGISLSTCNAIETAMQPRRKDRPQRVDAFLALLGAPASVVSDVDDEETEVVVEAKEFHPEKKPEHPKVFSGTDGVSRPSPKKWLLPLVLCLVAGLCIFGLSKCLDLGGDDGESPLPVDTLLLIDTIPEQEVQEEEPIYSNKVEDSNEENHLVSKVTLFYASTSPSGASVYVDGKYLGKTPIKGKEVSLGSHTIKITLDGYKAYSKKSTFGEKPFVLNETLEALPVEPAPASSASTSSAPSKSIEISLNETLEVSSVEPAPIQPVPVQSVPNKTVATGIINGHEWVDLGLSVKWATMNVGASSPSDYGSYFAWGETKTKKKYRESNSITFEKNISDISSNSNYDVVRSNWGDGWRLPTKGEFEELIKKCTWTWTTQGGHKGCKVTGPNGNSIFLPASGYKVYSSVYGIEVSGYYWSATPIDSGTRGACALFFGKESFGVHWYGRDRGHNVRGVANVVVLGA